MAITLAQWKPTSQDKLTNDIIDDMVTSPVLATLPFDDTIKPQGVSLAYAYNRITTQATANTRAINSEYTPQEAMTTQEVTNLKILGGSYQVDRVLASDERQVIGLVEFQAREKAKGAVALFHDLFINGDSATSPTQFDGIDKIARTRNEHIIDAEGLDLSTGALIEQNAHQMLYLLRQAFKGTQGFTHLGMNEDGFAVFQSIADFLPNVSYTRDEMGNGVYHYGNTRIVGLGQKAGTAEEVIPTSATGMTNFYLWREGMDGVHGLSPDGTDLVTSRLPNFLEAGAVKEGDVEFVTAIVAKKLNSIAIIENIKVAKGE